MNNTEERNGDFGSITGAKAVISNEELHLRRRIAELIVENQKLRDVISRYEHDAGSLQK